MILIRHKRTGNTKMFLDPHSAALDLWGKDAHHYQVFLEVRGLPPEITALEQQLTNIHNSLRDKTYAEDRQANADADHTDAQHTGAAERRD